ncbi:MAG: GDSL-type esterase/lipase family protein [Lachnospiraceae bacterium]|nr:GDSL-type esterase/lipase family protein [Lachnospiraceae bacterium]
MSEFILHSILNSPVRADRLAIQSRPALNQLEAREDVLPLLRWTAKGCTPVKAIYNRYIGALHVTVRDDDGKERTEQYGCGFAPYFHFHPVAEDRLYSLDPLASTGKAGQTVLLGDSLYDNWKTSSADLITDTEVQNFGVGGFTAGNVRDITLPRHALAVSPKRILLHVGVNDMFQCGQSLDAFLAEVRSLIARIHECLPETVVCFVSIIRPTDIAPTVTGLVGEAADARRKQVDDANAAMKALAESGTDPFFRYYDAERAYQDENGRSIPALFYPDGIHLLPAAYPAWGKALAEEIAKNG